MVRPPSEPSTAPPRAARETAPETLLARAVVATVVLTGIAFILCADRLHRGADDRALATELGAAADLAAAVLERELGASEGASVSRATLGGLQALARRHDVTRVSLLFPGGRRPLAIDHDGPTEARWTTPGEVPEGQIVGRDGLQLARTIEPRTGETLRLVVEASSGAALRRRAEWLGLQARLFVVLFVLAALAAPLAARGLLRRMRTAAGRATAELAPGAASPLGPTELLERVADELHAARALVAEDRRELAEERATRAANEERAARVVADARLDAERAAAEKAAFLSHVSHELRTPLHAIVSTSTLLGETALGAEQRALAGQIERGAEALSTLITDLLELSTVERGALVPELAPFAPEELVADVTRLVAPTARDLGVELLAAVDPFAPDVVSGDEARLRRMLLHLTDDAVRRVDGGAVEVNLRVEGAQGDARLVLEVVDDGEDGVDARRAELMGDPRPIQPGEAGLKHGLGLGLSLCRGLADALGGALTVEAAGSRGVALAASIPVTFDAGRPVREPVADGRRVLVVEDRDRGAAHLARLARAEGAEVEVETSAYSAFEQLSRGQAFDIVLLGATVPGRDALLGGIETLSAGGRRFPGVALVHPILGRRLAAGSLDEAVGAQLVKPVLSAEFRAALRAALDHDPTAPPEADVPAASEGTADSDEGGAKEPPRSMDGVRVLLVDDNETNRQLVQYVLGKRGYVVDVAVDGQAAVDAFAVGEFDVVLMDCQMPVMDGHEATRRIRKLEEGRARRTPVLAMSAGALAEDVQRCRDSGMDDHIAKPFQPRAMLAWLEGWVERTLAAEGAEDSGSCTPEAPRPRLSARAAGLFGAGPPTNVEGPLDGRDADADGDGDAAADAADAAADAVDAGGAAAGAVPAAATTDGGEGRGQRELDAALDRDVLGPLLEDSAGRALAHELVETFLARGPETIESLARALANGAFEDASRTAHRFVSTSGTVGAVRLAKVLRRLQNLSRTAAHDAEAAAEARELAGRARAELDVAQRALGALFPG